jgi:HSP20 family protein
MASNDQIEESGDKGTERPRAGRSRSASRQPQPPSLLQDVDRLWDSFIERFGRSSPWPFPLGDQRVAAFGQRPRVDVEETADDIVVTAEMPGLRREDVDISMTNDVLTLRCEQSSDSEREQGGFHRREIVRGSFVRQIRLPCPVDVERATADYRDGMLTVTMPKTAQGRSRKIPLTAGGEAGTESGAAGPDTTH